MNLMDVQALNLLTDKARMRLLRLFFEAQSAHLGSCLSSLEAVMALFHKVMAEDDRFILSKGHAAGLLYVALWSKSLLDEATLCTFCQDGTTLPGHPSGHNIPKLLCPTGSLGHGASLAAGFALAARLNQQSRHVWCLCSDGEWQEGSSWEALIFAVHHKLDNLTILVDQNGWQGFGTTKEVASISDLTPRFTSFGAYASLIDGHDQNAIIAAAIDRRERQPRVLVLNTIKGRGTSLENQLSSHYLPPQQEEYKKIAQMKEVKK